MRRLLPLFLVMVSACGNKNKEPAPAASASAALTPAAAPSASAAPANGPEDAARKVVRAWNDALDKHDVAALDALYGDPVFFYTKPMSKKTVLAAKKSALGPKSTFHQKIMDEIVVTKSGTTWSAVFTKQSGNGTRLGETKAQIVLGGSPLVITEERDAPSTASACGAAAAAVAYAIPAVKKLMDDTRKAMAKDPQLIEGGIGPATMDDGTIVGDWGVFHPENFERVLSWTAYPNGRLDVHAGAADYTTDPSSQTMDGVAAKKLSEDDRKKVTVACGPPADSHTGGGH